MSLLPTKLLMSWEDIGADHSDVPAMLICGVLKLSLQFPLKGQCVLQM